MDLFDNSGAAFSSCGLYRYTLYRKWDESRPMLLIIGLNPSTADAIKDDPTIRRCINYAKAWGFGGLYMGNIFGFRATDPKKMKAIKYPIGDENNAALKHMASMSGLTLFAWGTHGIHLDRDKEVIEMFPDAYCLAKSKEGHPKHPLYLKAELHPIPFRA